MKQRPVNLDLTTIKLPISAIVSITHRLSGVVLFLGFGLLLYLLEFSLRSEASFIMLAEKMDSLVCRFLIWICLSALIYHVVAGIRHLFMDMGIGDTKICGKYAAILTICISSVLISLLGVWLW